LDTLISLLDEHQSKHSKEYFYMVRAQLPADLSPLEQAARFIYLNKTCFNGLYRVNKEGQFNVPFGRYKNPLLYNLENLRLASSVLKSVELFAENYHSFLKEHARPGDFIYLDPPYSPISQYSDFKRYTKEQFREKDQCELAQLYNELVELGTYPILSNSYSEITLELYAQHKIHIIYSSRNINHKGTGREPVPEILVEPR
jgi:DNA adenine methylase